jgi:hypothetical protein
MHKHHFLAHGVAVCKLLGYCILNKKRILEKYPIYPHFHAIFTNPQEISDPSQMALECI